MKSQHKTRKVKLIEKIVGNEISNNNQFIVCILIRYKNEIDKSGVWY